METIEYEGDVAFEPRKAHAADAGFDLVADLPDTGLVLRPGQTALVECGFKAAIPEGMVGLVCPRSGLAANHGVTVLNAPGVIDSGYRGTWAVVLVHLGKSHLHIRPGDRIAQVVVLQLADVQWRGTEELMLAGERGAAGFGSTDETKED